MSARAKRDVLKRQKAATRNAAIISAIGKGTPVVQIAKTFGITPQAVYQRRQTLMRG